MQGIILGWILCVAHMASDGNHFHEEVVRRIHFTVRFAECVKQSVHILFRDVQTVLFPALQHLCTEILFRNIQSIFQNERGHFVFRGAKYQRNMSVVKRRDETIACASPKMNAIGYRGKCHAPEMCARMKDFFRDISGGKFQQLIQMGWRNAQKMQGFFCISGGYIRSDPSYGKKTAYGYGPMKQPLRFGHMGQRENFIRTA